MEETVVADNRVITGKNGAASEGTVSVAEEFGRLYEQYLPGVYRYVLYRVGDRENAEDLTEDIFQKALSGYARYDSRKASFSTWLFSIARNTVIDYYRRHAREAKLSREIETDIPANTGSPEDDAARTEDLGKLKECLLKLNPNEQEIISLKFSGSMTNRDIARLTGLSESNVGTILCRALRKLRDDFAGWHDNG